MGKTVNNMYGSVADSPTVTLEIVSKGRYQIEIVFYKHDSEAIQKYNWCFDAGKGLVYTHDLKMELASAMGYITPRVYLRDYLVFLRGFWKGNKPTFVWRRTSMTDYRLPV